MNLLKTHTFQLVDGKGNLLTKETLLNGKGRNLLLPKDLSFQKMAKKKM